MQISPIRGFNYGNNFVQQKNNVKNSTINSSITPVQKTLNFGKASTKEILDVVGKLFTDITKISKESETPNDIFKVRENFMPKADKILDNIKKTLMPLIKDSDLPKNSTENVLNSGINFYKREERIYFEKCASDDESENLLTINPSENSFCIEIKNAVETDSGKKFSLKQAFLKRDFVKKEGEKGFYIGYYPDNHLSPDSCGVISIGSRIWDSTWDGFFI